MLIPFYKTYQNALGCVILLHPERHFVSTAAPSLPKVLNSWTVLYRLEIHDKSVIYRSAIIAFVQRYDQECIDEQQETDVINTICY